MKLSNNPSFVILIFAILKFEIQIVLHFVTPIPIGVQISEDVPVPGEVLVAEGIWIPEDIRVPEHFRVPEIFRYSTEKKLKIPDPT